MNTNDVLFKGKTMLSTIDYARTCGVSPAYPDSSVAEVIGALVDEIERRQQDHRDFTSRLGFGDDISEPAASLSDMVDPIEAAFSEQRDHWECPQFCELCGERLASTRCPECHGSGCNAPACEASGAYAECEYCAGVGWVHDGCVENTYADLAAEVEKLHGTVDSFRALAETYKSNAAQLPEPHGPVTQAFEAAARDILAIIDGTDQ
ncbi:hypothetical protein [Mycolicibacterium mucogenicum]|uniref:Uncharacterized protein n=1 Tax=Mycolicibacterium mucogenicum DSM 44124 TaxID=1226753 RepID=A0A8H2J906_MYCMU|nr:hypothetical protein [Mycolicibacterium mucogenicum]KAB7761784.1 hypothetical protein MMUC44124_01085 [Mycolicibacterium mucogenicum DSM 44124]QPG70022.1 hypothetical protein C1S78_003055 [Mycolicibacterium mucogenicum DSM 44124]